MGEDPHFVDSLEISDEWLSDFLDELAGDDSQYLMSVIPVEILGSAYERFLGSVVTDGGAVVPKPEIRKSQGVYYTPRAIVDEIIELTVGCAIAGKSPRQLRTFRVLDPACGSGSFLLGAFERLCQHHIAWLVAHPLEQKKAICYRSETGDLRLTTSFKRTLLLNSIYGVDLDAQAVEVTQMSLYLKVLEDETTQTLNADHRLFPKETYLPDLDDNIKHGDSLIEFDKLLDLGDPDMIVADGTAFDWQAEFPGALESGGFDVVLGNPPYFSVEKTWGKRDPRLSYLRRFYEHVYQDRSDILFYFLARAAQLSKGSVCFIVSRAFLEAHKATKLRGWLGKVAAPLQIIDFSDRYIFDGVGITTAIVKLDKGDRSKDALVFRAKVKDDDGRAVAVQIADEKVFDRIVVPRSKFGTNSWLFGTAADEPLISKIDRGKTLAGTALTIGQGMQTGLNEAFGGHPLSIVKEWGLPKNAWFIRAKNSDIHRWRIHNTGEVLLFPNAFSRFAEIPKGMRDHLQHHRKELAARAACIRGNCEWWQYTWPLHEEHYEGPRIYCPYLATENRFALDHKRRFLGLTDTTVLFGAGGREDLRYFVGLLNSNVLTWRFRFIGKLKGGGIREYFHNSVAKLPIHRINWQSRHERDVHDHIVAEVSKLMDLHEEAGRAASRASRINAIARVEDDLNDSVRELYGLSISEYAKIRDALHIAGA